MENYGTSNTISLPQAKREAEYAICQKTFSSKLSYYIYGFRNLNNGRAALHHSPCPLQPPLSEQSSRKNRHRKSTDVLKPNRKSSYKVAHSLLVTKVFLLFLF